MSTTTFPYRLTRAGTSVSPAPGDELDAEGLVNPTTIRETASFPLSVPRGRRGCRGNPVRLLRHADSKIAAPRTA